MLLFWLFGNSILSKPLIQHPAVSFCMFWSLWYRLFSNVCFSFNILYIYFCRGSIALVCAQLSMWYLDYAMFQTRNCWCSVVIHVQDVVMSMLCTAFPDQAATTHYMNNCHKATLGLPKIQDQNASTLCWPLFCRWGRKLVANVFGLKSSQYLLDDGLQRIATKITHHAKRKIVDTSLMLIFRMG